MRPFKPKCHTKQINKMIAFYLKLKLQKKWTGF